MESGKQINHHANRSRATSTTNFPFTTSERANFSHAPNPPEQASGPGTVTAPLVRLKMLLNNSPLYLRKRALMLDGPPRGRSPVALRKRKHSSITTHHITEHHQSTGTFKRSKPRSRSRSCSQRRPTGMLSYPPYIPIPGVFTNQARSPTPMNTESHIDSQSRTRMEMIRGTTCQLVMQLLSEYRSIREVLDQLPFECDSDDANRMGFEVKDIQAIATRCREHGLTAHTPLQVDAEDWEGEEIEEWWHDAMEEGWRDDHIEMEGWWMKLESRRHRDWARWPSVSIGPRNERKQLKTDDDF